MSMLDALNLVKGAVSEKDLLPALTHIAVQDGRVHGYNGRVHISALCSELNHMSFTAPMLPFVTAAEACAGAPRIMLDELKGAMQIHSDTFSALLPVGKLADYPLPDVSDLKKIEIRGLLPVLAALRPFIGQDATRPWSASIKFDGAVALATNNVTLVEAALHNVIPPMALPVFAVDELLRLGHEPTHVSVQPNAAVFYYDSLPAVGLWLRTQLFEQGWPDAQAILRGCLADANLRPVPAGLLAAVQQVRPFCADAKYPLIRLAGGDAGNYVCTLDGALQASIRGLAGGPLGKGVYHADPLAGVLSVAINADWDRFPKVPWTGAAFDVALRGVLLGIPNI